MREITIGEKNVGIRATPYTALIYKQEFGTTAVSDFLKFANGLNNLKKFVNGEETGDLIDDVLLLQLVWAMAKADAQSKGESIPSFQAWVSDIESFDFFDVEMLTAVFTEGQKGFFPKGGRKFVPPSAR